MVNTREFSNIFVKWYSLFLLWAYENDNKFIVASELLKKKNMNRQCSFALLQIIKSLYIN